jgi:dTDP-4-amino-4,6-dideoxygalactose transaminase
MNQIDLFKVFMSETAGDKVKDVLYSGYIGQGKKVEEFEQNLSQFLNTDFVSTLNSGTSALHLALHLIKQKFNEDDFEVITTPLTCTATNWPILANGLKIKWADIDPKTMNIDLDDVARKITRTTKAIMLVHWGGYPVDMNKLNTILDKAEKNFGFRPLIIEDCAHAMGSYYNGKHVGTEHGFGCFSFQAIKHVTSVDGGMIVCPNLDYHKKTRLLRWYGIDRESNRKDFRCEANIENWGFKFHMNDVCATIGVENLKEANGIISKHQANAAFYDKELKNTPGLTMLERKPECKSSFWIYSMLVENRDGFYAAMKEKNIVVSQVHERNDIHTCVNDYKAILPNLDATIGKLVNIPVGWWVTKEQREYIVNSIKKGW